MANPRSYARHPSSDHRRWLAAAVGLVVALPAVACSTAGASGDEDSTSEASEPSATDVLQAMVDDIVAGPAGPPAALVTVHVDGEDTTFVAGVADLGAEAPPGTDLAMRIASMSKAFSGAVALTLADRGDLAVDSTIGEILPELPAAWHRVTLGQMLQHTSGLPDYSGSQSFADAVTASPEVAPPPVELLGYVADEPLVFEPATDYAYSNSDNAAVALMAEQVTGRPYAELLADLVTDPLRLSTTVLPEGTGMPTPLLHGYDVSEDPPEDVSELVAFGGWAWASGGIVSTPDEVGAFVRGLLSGAFFGSAARDAQHDVVPGDSDPPGPGTNHAGLGLFRYDTACGTVWGHTGSILGWTQFMAASEDGSASVTTTLSTQADDDLVGDLRELQEAAVCLALDDADE